MHSHENNITYDNVDSYVLENIPGFSKYYYENGYDEEDRELKYMVFGALTAFFRDIYEKDDQAMITLIVDELNKLYNLEDKMLKELILTGFIENLLEDDKEKISQLRETLKYPELQKCLDELYKFWYKTLPDSYEKPKNNYANLY